MIRKYPFGGIILGLASFVWGEAQAMDELWEQAERFVMHSKICLPGEIETLLTVKNAKGETDSETYRLLKVSEDEATGLPQGKLVRLLENGKEVGRKCRDETEREVQQGLNRIERDVPFHYGNPSDLLTGKREERKTIDGLECVGYDFDACEMNDDDGDTYQYAGTVWIDPSTAVPVAIESHLLDVPRKENGAEIMSLVLSCRYDLFHGALVKVSETRRTWRNTRFLFKEMILYVESETAYRAPWFFEPSAKNEEYAGD